MKEVLEEVSESMQAAFHKAFINGEYINLFYELPLLHVFFTLAQEFLADMPPLVTGMAPLRVQISQMTSSSMFGHRRD
jgi:hypothetical protein